MSTLLCTLGIVNAILAADREITLRRTFWAVAWIESRGDPRAVNRAEDAVGIIQIRPIMLRDANRIIGYEKWTLADRLDVQKCYEMFRLVVRYYYPKGNPEQWCRLWNSGPEWRTKKHLTDIYWKKCKKVLDTAGMCR